ncbi:MAG: flagellar hook-associated protein 2 [Fusobacteriaceae bacterium]|nr:flagellar hook-associated protein 2 [Fusobacteriaceae bacterium]
MGIQLTGLASGMDTNSMVKKLVEVEKKPIETKKVEISKLEEQKKEWMDIEKKVGAVKTAAQTLNTSAKFNNKETSVSNEALVTAEASANVKNGVYVIEDIKLARPAQVSSREELPLKEGRNSTIISSRTKISNPNDKFLDVFFSFINRTDYSNIGFKINGVNISVTPEDTVGLFLNKINQSNAGVKAMYDSKRRRIIFESKNETAAIKIEANDKGFLRELGLDQYNGKEVKNGVKSESFKLLKDSDYFRDVKNGYFTINGYTFNVDPTRDSLKSIISKVNNSGANVRAVYDEGSKKISFISTIPGEDMIIENDNSGLLKKLKVMQQTKSGRDKTRSFFKGQKASFKMDGVTYERSSNSIELDGLKINLKNETKDGEKVTIKVDYNTDAALEEIANFLYAYNQVVETIEEKTKKDGILQGDTTATSLLVNLRNKMTASVNGIEDKYNQLALIGVETDAKSGKLTVNEAKLRQAISENPLEIKKLFTQKANDAKPVDLGIGNGTKSVFDPTEPLPGDIEDIRVVVGDKSYSLDNQKNPIIKKSELYKYTVSRLDLIKYIINGDVKTKDEALAKLGKKLPPNAVIIDDVTGKIEFGTPPKKGEKIYVESKKVSTTKKTGTDEGVSRRMETFLAPYTRYGGTLKNRIKYYDERIDTINDWIDESNERISRKEDMYKAKFGTMEGALQNSNSLSSWLNGQIAGL